MLPPMMKVASGYESPPTASIPKKDGSMSGWGGTSVAVSVAGSAEATPTSRCSPCRSWDWPGRTLVSLPNRDMAGLM